MKLSLYFKFIFGYLLFGLLSFVSIATLSSYLTYKNTLKEKAETLYDEANLIASSYSGVYSNSGVRLDIAQAQLEAIALYLDSEIWIVNVQGSIVTSTSHTIQSNVMIDQFDPTAIGSNHYIISNYYDYFSYDVLSVSAPITGNHQTHGYVIIHLPLYQLQNQSEDYLTIIYISALVVFLLSLIILLVFTKIVYFPLKKITAGANEYAAGNLTYHIKLQTHDEMGYLADTLNYMSDELNKMEEYQHNFIANVSHDFRSPLTSIKGYLEAILDGTIPPELQEKYLTLVISETERLNKLTQSILTLNTLDSKGYLSRSNFDITLIIKDTAASFEGTCNDKNITFDLIFSNNSLNVFADLGKIQQVLYNLIDNAIKFSHTNSIIYIEASMHYEKVFVSVKDTGVGIPKQSIKKVWERFYKTDSSRGKDRKGTGLGLAIVKEIIQSHGENIDVISTEGVGTEFIFSLPCKASES